LKSDHGGDDELATVPFAAGNDHAVQSATWNKVNLRIHGWETDADGAVTDNLWRELARQSQAGSESGFARPSFQLLGRSGHQLLLRRNRHFCRTDAGQ